MPRDDKALLIIGALLATAFWSLIFIFQAGASEALRSIFHLVADIELPASGSLELSVIIASIIVIWILGKLRDSHFKNAKAADAIGLVASTLIGACAVFYVGRFADETQRNVGINTVLGQLERVIDTHQSAKPCARYIMSSPDLMRHFAPNTEPRELPENENKSLCFAQFFLKTSKNPDDPKLKAAEWLYLREQLLSVINALELAANYAVVGHIYTRDEAQLPVERLNSQQLVVRYINGMTATETKHLMLSMIANGSLKKPYEAKDKNFFRVCQILDCNED